MGLALTSGRSADRGFTLVELMVVVAIMALLASMGIGLFASLGGRNALEVVGGEVTSLVRRPRNASREERFPVRIILDSATGSIRAVGRRTVALFRFEDDDLMLPDPVGFFDPELPLTEPGGASTGADPMAAPAAYGLRGSRGMQAMANGVEPDPNGKMGSGLLFDQPGAYVTIAHEPVLAPREGILVDLWMRPGDLGGLLAFLVEEALLDLDVLDANRPWTFRLVRKAGSFEVLITEDMAIEVAVWGESQALGDVVEYRVYTRPGVVAIGRWSRVAVRFEAGEGLHIEVDGIGRYAEPLRGPGLEDEPPELMAESREDLLLGDPDVTLGFVGGVDELEISAIVSGDPVRLPASLAMLSSSRELVFNAQGGLDGLRHDEAVVIVITDDPDLVEKIASGDSSMSTTTDDEAGSAAVVADPEAMLGDVDERSRVVIRVDLTGALRW